MSQRVPEPSRPVAAVDLHEQPLQRGFPKWDWRSLPFVLMHAGAVVLPFFTTFSWNLVALAIGLYLVRMFAITGGYHRYFSHRSFQTSRAFQFALAAWGRPRAEGAALVGRPSPAPPQAPRPARRHALARAAWLHLGPRGLDPLRRLGRPTLERVKDFAEYPELRWLNP